MLQGEGYIEDRIEMLAGFLAKYGYIDNSYISMKKFQKNSRFCPSYYKKKRYGT